MNLPAVCLLSVAAGASFVALACIAPRLAFAALAVGLAAFALKTAHVLFSR